ncbi:MAG TPA: hypothetical protein VJ875_09770 [Pyrinomonadaceae bacterium]|nr:hypothetical protein [Pyrinomonadaceae bacterium]
MTATPTLWENPAGALHALAAALGIDPTKKFNEGPDELSFSDENFALTLSNDPVTRERQLSVLDSAMLGMKTKYGPSLTLRLKLAGQQLTIDDYSQAKLENFCKKVGNDPFELLITIDKAMLAAYWDFDAPDVSFKIFLFLEALVRALTIPLSEVEQDENSVLKGFTGERKLFILVPDHTVGGVSQSLELNGDYLAVLGGGAVGNWRNYLPQNSSDEALRKVKYVYAEAVDTLKWTQVPHQFLTPLHLLLDWPKPKGGNEQVPDKNDLIARPLFAQLLALSVLYTARESRFPSGSAEVKGGSWVATYEADKYLANIDVPDIEVIGNMLVSDTMQEPWQACQTAGRLAQWIYKEERGISNRSEVLQVAVASFLQDGKSSENLAELVLKAREIFERVQRRWDQFMEERLHKYFSQIKELEERVESTTKTYNEQFQSLTKGLTDNMLAAVAVIVGSFIAAIFKSPFQRYIFVFGLAVYALYLMIFPMAVGLVSQCQRFKDARDGFRKRQREFINRLSAAEVRQIVGNRISQNEQRFRRWFWLTTGLYTLVLISLIAAILLVPALLKNWTDDFSLTEASFEAPADREVVPLVIRGDGFDNTKEIVVTVGNSKLSNTDGKSVKVHGATVLTLTPPRADLAGSMLKNEAIRVRQGEANEQTIALPATIPPPAEAAFESLTWNEDGSLETTGSKLNLIPQLQSGGMKVPFKVSDDGRKLEITDQKALKKLHASRILEIVYKDGVKASVSLPASPISRKAQQD